MNKIYIIAIVALFASDALCQFSWTRHPDPVLDAGTEGSWDALGVGYPSVLLIEDTLHMWYGGLGNLSNPTLAIGHATSTDGISWIKDTLNPVLTGGGEGSWDQESVYVPRVLYLDTAFYMWYNGSSSGTEMICLATSPDGRNWTKHPDNPVLETGSSGSWDSDFVGPGSVYFDTAFHLWYAGGKGDLASSGYATSEDGIDWTKHPENPVLESVSSGAWDYPGTQMVALVYKNSLFHAWYGGGKFFEWEIGYASSPDGITWTKSESNPVIAKGESGSWDDGFVAFPTVLFDVANGKFRMWYHGGMDLYSQKIGYAESSATGFNPPLSDPGTVSVFPNPFSEILNVSMNDQSGIRSIELISLDGRIVRKFLDIASSNYAIRREGLAAGIYILRIKGDEILYRKVMVE